MKNTRKNILNASKVLFNELGYSQVTIRMIALQLNMSSGNLNYHFKKRENIVKSRLNVYLTNNLLVFYLSTCLSCTICRLLNHLSTLQINRKINEIKPPYFLL